jgi:metal-responsive CopG/Arc/MetJ family transcriptional regulator
MDETRTRRFSISLPPTLADRLDRYAEDHRWSRSTAIEVLVEKGLDKQEGDDDDGR